MSIDDRLPPLNDGCTLHPRCLECPRPRCILDEMEDRPRLHPPRKATPAVVERIQAMSEEGTTVSEIAKATGLHYRTVMKIRSQQQGAGEGRPK